jgi:hypothetical protein
MEELDLDDAKKRYHFALAPEDYERVPFYAALLKEFEGDELALALLAEVRREQRLPILILAILHFAALQGHPVLEPIFAAARHDELADIPSAVAEVVRVLHDSPELVRSESWRSTQTNEPGRGAVLQALFLEVASSTPIDIIEVGTSAGINLCFDQFPVRRVDDNNPLTLVCDDITPIDRSRALPTIESRVGIDLHPLSLDDLDDRLWLKACIWPEERRRHVRFDAVVAARPTWPHTTSLAGRALERLEDAFALGSGALTVVFNTWTMFYFDPEERLAYVDALTRRCAKENVTWISIESTLVEIPGVAVHEDAHHRGASQIVVTLPGSVPTLWGWCHSHGRWLEQITEA